MTSFLKSLIDFMEPTGLVWLVLATLTVLHLKRRERRLLWLSGSAWLLLSITSMLPVPHMLMASLEDDWPTVDVATMPECDAIVVLGGGMEPSQRELPGLILKDGAGRVFSALVLAREGKGRQLVIGGGIFKTTDGREVFEADGVRDWLKDWAPGNVPVQSLGGCTDTHDEAMRVAALAKEHGWKQVALVTSAYHMTRSKAVFEKAGMAVLPVPCNYASARMRGRPLPWVNVPNASYLQLFETWMHEIVGMAAYKLRGWI